MEIRQAGFFLGVALGALTAGPAFGQAQDAAAALAAAPALTVTQEAQLEALTAAREEATGKQSFAGLNFGVGVSLTIDGGAHSRVKDAAIIDGVVRVTDEDDKLARVLLESHYFFVSRKHFPGNLVDAGQWGWGPFIALQPGTDEVIEAVGGGLMIGFRRPGDASGSSWNIGIGGVSDLNVKVLGDGFVENMAPPGAETAVRYKTKSQDGWVVIASFSF